MLPCYEAVEMRKFGRVLMGSACSGPLCYKQMGWIETYLNKSAFLHLSSFQYFSLTVLNQARDQAAARRSLGPHFRVLQHAGQSHSLTARSFRASNLRLKLCNRLTRRLVYPCFVADATCSLLPF